MAAVTLISKGAPFEHARLNTTWYRDPMEPDINGHPHFINNKGSLHLFRTVDGLWEIAPEIDAGKAFAVARSAAHHPNTVRPGEWSLPQRGSWGRSAGFKVTTEGPNSEEHPYDVHDDLGADFFIRVRTTKVVWFKDPTTGETLHSGAKAAGAAKKPGKRYCPLCDHCFSANNFVSQHLRNLHTPPPPTQPVALPDGKGGVQLSWKAVEGSEGARPVSFAVQFSTDGGANWTTGVEDTLSVEPRAQIGSLNPSQTYLFRVATHSVAALGPYSDPSGPLVMDSGLPPPQQLTLPEPASLEEPSLTSMLAEGVVTSHAPEPPTKLSSFGGEPQRQSAPPFLTFPEGGDLQTPPLSPMDNMSLAMPMTAAPAPSTHTGKRGLGALEPPPEESTNAATADLVWSIDDLVRTAREAEDEGDDTSNMLANLFGGPSKRQKQASQSREEVFLEDLLSSLDDVPSDLSPSGQLSLDGSVYRTYDKLPASCQKEASLRRLSHESSVRREMSSARRTSRSPAPRKGGATNGAASQGATDEETSESERARLAKLRLALAAAPSFAKAKLLTPELLKLVCRAGKARELSLILTHAPATAANAAAAEDAACRKAKDAQKTALPPPTGEEVFRLPPAKAGSRRRTGVGAVASLLRSTVVVALLGLALASSWPALTDGLASLMPAPPPPPPPPSGFSLGPLFGQASPPKPACQWTYFGTCVPATKDAGFFSSPAGCQWGLDFGALPPSLTCSPFTP